MNDLLGGRYRLGAPLGRGGMGTVYEAVQVGLGRRVALKLLDPRLADGDCSPASPRWREQLERFRREAEVVAALGHPNIVQVTDFQYPEEPGQQPFLVMELLRGESLGSLVERERALPAGRVAFIAAQVLSALVAAHRAGVVHRDIKPDNVFLLGDAAVPDTAKVLDFGIAKLSPSSSLGGRAKLTGTGAMLGTPAFMAPEQARGEADVDARADVYAVGATMYQALTGRLPYEAASIQALLFAIVEKTPAPLGDLRPDLPSDLVAVVERAMAKDRAARFPDADAMRRALAPWSGLPASLPPPVSATAATVASGRIAPHDPSTPIVVHQTPPGKSVAPAASSRPHGRSVLSQILLAVTVLGVAAMGMVVAIVAFNRPKGPVASTSASAAAGDALSSTLAPPPASGPTAIPLASASASATAVAPAASAPRLRRYGGATAWVNSGDYGACPGCDWEAFRRALDTKSAATSACFAASQHEPPHHETPYYQVGVADDGKVTSFRALSDGAPRLDACLRGVVASVPMPMKARAAGSFKIGFDGPCKRGMENLPHACD